MAASKATKRKPREGIEKVIAKRAIADINALFKTQKKLDLELKKIRRHIKKLLGHQYLD
jgi:hypothetical protein